MIGAMLIAALLAATITCWLLLRFFTTDIWTMTLCITLPACWFVGYVAEILTTSLREYRE